MFGKWQIVYSIVIVFETAIRKNVISSLERTHIKSSHL